jgi:hypothetical protein
MGSENTFQKSGLKMNIKDFTVVVTYREVLAEAEAKAKYSDLSELANLREYRKLCNVLLSNKNRSLEERHLIALKSQKAKELIELKTIRRN